MDSQDSVAANSGAALHIIPRAEGAAVFVLYKNTLFRDLMTGLLGSSASIDLVGSSDSIERSVETIQHSHVGTVLLEGSGHNVLDRALFGYLTVALAESRDVQLLMLDLSGSESTSWHWRSSHQLDAGELRELVLSHSTRRMVERS